VSTPAREPIGVIGTGYVGLVTAAGFADLGSEVWCIDIDETKIERLKRGEVPIFEPGLEECLARNRDRLHFSTDLTDALEHARLLFVAVGTPPTYSGDADLSAVHAVVAAMPPSDAHALVMKSTVPVGTGANVQRLFGEQGKEGFRYVSCPEFLKEGTALADFLHPDRVVVGDEGDWAGDAVVELYRPLLTAEHGGSGPGELVRTDIASAEMVKLAANAFLATKISFINEIANVCEETGADVLEVARGMGLDQRIGPKFLQPGIGFGGSCLAGEETVLARRLGRTRLVALEELFHDLSFDVHPDQALAGVVRPAATEVLSWEPGCAGPSWRPLEAVTRRRYEGDLITVRTKTGRSLRATPDHPFVARRTPDGGDTVVLAADLTEQDWLPVPVGGNETPHPPGVRRLRVTQHLPVAEAAVIVRPRERELAAVAARPAAERAALLDHPRGSLTRLHDIRRAGALRLDEARRIGLDEDGATYATARNGTHVPREIAADAAFWRVVGLYLAEGHCTTDGGRERIAWSFHPEREEDLVEEVAGFWRSLGVKADVRRMTTTRQVSISSRLLAHFWGDVLGLGRNAGTHRLPDLIWDAPEADRRALLAGLWRGDGSWSLVNGGPSVILEYGTVSRDLADGVLRLLAGLGIVASMRTGRTAKSTRETYWLRISGAAQVERMLDLVAERDRLGITTAISLQAKRIAPTGHRRDPAGTAWVRVTGTERVPAHRDWVYSLEVPGAHTFVATGGLVTHNCFPKDVSALKQLAGNSGYHFQLLNAVIEVNELQKRRVIGKLEKHLGSLVGQRIALLGLAFKPNTDDMREASSLVLAARLQAAGAQVVAYDPIAEEEARHLMHGVEFAPGAMDAVTGADAVVLVTEWDEFRALDLAEVAGAMRGDVLIDGRNALDGAAAGAAGLRYEGIGRAA
jgi:UDPglucose 6-dehydrogenase